MLRLLLVWLSACPSISCSAQRNSSATCSEQPSSVHCLQVLMPPISGRRIVDFGPGLGRRTCYLYNLPEVFSGNECMKVGAALRFDMLSAASVSVFDYQQPVTLSHCGRSEVAVPG